ncbi:MAG: signal peptidase II [Terrimicrobiaceae bacterium]|nr:signal peptidase II [Terrimicrobiaceae bacterium]
MKWFLLLSLPLYVIDQITKVLVLRNMGLHDVIPVVPGFFNIVRVHNTGAAFGMLRDNNTFFIVLAAVATIVLAFFAWRGAFNTPLLRIGAALLASGIVGNLTDRILHGYVVDFVDVILPWYGHWPAFNVADSCICIAATLFIVSGFLPEKKT